MANFCKNCGSKLNPGARFCENCGQPILNESNPPKINSYVPNNGSNMPRSRYTKDSGKEGAKKGVNFLNIVLAGVMIIELLLVFFWHPGLLHMKKTKEIVLVSGEMGSDTLSLDTFSVRFDESETGEALLIPDQFILDAPDNTQIYDLAFTSIPDEPFTVEVEALEPAEDEVYIVDLGIPVTYASGKESFELVPIKARWEDGKARAFMTLDGVDEYLAGINYDAAGEMAAIATSRITDFGKNISLLNLVSYGWNRIGEVEGAVVLYFSKVKEVESSKGHFRLLIPEGDYDQSNKSKCKVRKSDAENYAADMEEIYEYYAKRYNVRKRTAWPMDIYFKRGVDYVACFDTPTLSAGGRIAYDSINDSYMKIDLDKLIPGYGPGRETHRVTLYGAFAHEMFHFVQRCYVDRGGTQRWFDESSAAYFDSLFTGMKYTFKLEENYCKEWQDQFSIMTNNPTIYGRQYGRMPVFCYLMQRNENNIKSAYEYLEDTGGFTGWKAVFEFAAKTTMAPFTRAYFQELVSKGTLYSKYNTPWEIYKAPIDPDQKQAPIDKAAWKALRYNEKLKSDGQEGSYVLPSYSARFVILDTSELPDKDLTLNLKLTTPAVDGTLYKIEGDSYDKVTYNVIPSEKETSMAVKKDDKLLLMLVNESNSDCNGAVTYSTGADITPFLGQYEIEGVVFQDGIRQNWRMIIKEDYIRLPNNGVNQLFYDSYEVDGNTLTLHFRDVEWDYIITLLNYGRISVMSTRNGEKNYWNPVPAGQEWEEWGEIYDH